jgi:hypothetical protein
MAGDYELFNEETGFTVPDFISEIQEPIWNLELPHRQ